MTLNQGGTGIRIHNWTLVRPLAVKKVLEPTIFWAQSHSEH